MNFALAAFVLMAVPNDIVLLAEADVTTLSSTDGTRYLSLMDVDEKDRDSHLALTSYVLNSVSKEKTIKIPVFVNKAKTLMRFNINDYKIAKEGYDSLGKNKELLSARLNKTLGCENPILRSEYFIAKSLTPSSYYKFLGIKDLNGFRKMVGFTRQEEIGAVVSDSLVARSAQQIRRYSTTSGYVWEIRDGNKDYLNNFLCEEYDSIQLLASNANGLLYYFAADDKGNAQETISPIVKLDSSVLDKDKPLVSPLIHVARNCINCHGDVGVFEFKDSVRGLLKKLTIGANTGDKLDKFKKLYVNELSFDADIKLYQEALQKATSLKPQEFKQTYVKFFENYNLDLTFKQVASRFGISENALKDVCTQSRDVYLIKLFLDGKIRRDRFEEIIGE